MSALALPVVRGRQVWAWARIAFCAVMLALVLAPLLWTVFLSFRTNIDLLRQAPLDLRGPYTLDNYAELLRNQTLFRWFFNSLVVSTVTVAGVLTLSSLAGYAFGRLEFPGRNWLYLIVLAGLAIPDQSVILTRHQIFSDLHWHNTYRALILPGLSAPLGVFLMTEAFRAIPRAQDDAARLDRANAIATFWHVLLPQTVPALASLGIYTFLLSWNDYWWPLISATRPSMYTLTEGMAAAQSNYVEVLGKGVLMAEAVVAGLPVLIVYILFQKHIVNAVTGMVKL
ncbi:binding-protein-dependent transport system inner membrane component family protein [Asticcacaulis biprosthecium C19]|uniref:Binding-protein-dependent transport system inner membrane component family protein n=1 Tax=Asticcacaulis biprosthecium C19 TaxID=715226 RepID=F4QJE6_9CAUL|nr:carbohydrate ABC transporter permease [Asticcacaulis biprosthecium]EGF93129.1 binding-protein-dependent transport system inner membrane component family protein [Asticcacaulis biprosthecium C19]